MNDKLQNSVTKSKSFPIVGIGASAGGLSAITELLQNLSPLTGMAYIYIQHLDPTHESALSTLLQGTTAMKVREATDMVVVESNHVYVLPPNKRMKIVEGTLKVLPRGEKTSLHMPINEFFISLAERHQEGAIGIVLSGSASDGTVGLRAIKQSGGLSFAQNETAEFQSMPRSAISEGVVDLVLSPREMARELERISTQKDALKALLEEEEEENEDAATEGLDDEMGGADGKYENMLPIIQIVKKSTGVDFSHYKSTTLRRRIIRRTLLHRINSFQEYVDFLSYEPGEVQLLYQDLLIHVTSFFRDPDLMDYMKKKLLPRIFKSKNPGDTIRMWVPACSTGEEAYSLAMICIEIMGEKSASEIVQIFATDISKLSIAKARLGVYTSEELMNISVRRKQQFFTKIDDSYRISKSVRNLCVFAHHNVFKDPPFSKLDLVSCCNLMIYLDQVLQKTLLATFHYSIHDDGYLLIGKSEAITSSTQLFTQSEKKFKVFKKKPTAHEPVFEISPSFKQSRKSGPGDERGLEEKNQTKLKQVQKQVDDLLFSKFVPASVLINTELEILQFRGSTGLFLEPSPGKASFNLIKMAREGLAFDLRTSVHKANKTNSVVQKSGIKFKNNNEIHEVGIEVVPIQAAYNDERCFLIIFQLENKGLGSKHGPERYTKDKAVKQLQDEIILLKEDLRLIVEDQEASNQDLQSANEEIVSSNEELQSINEELETSNEELESTNEELMTINSELQVRNDQIAEAYEFNDAIYSTMREALLLLDKNYKVKKANQSFYKIFKIREEELEGSVIFDVNDTRWNIPNLKEVLEKISAEDSSYEGWELKHWFPVIGEKVFLLNAKLVIQKTHQQELVLLVMQDITSHKSGLKIIEEREAWLRNISDNAPVMIWVADTEKLVTFVNKTWLNFTGKTFEEECGSGWTNGIDTDDYASCLTRFNESFKDRKEFVLEYRLRRSDGLYRWMTHIGKPIFLNDHVFAGYIGSCTEIHDKKIMYEELENRVEQRTVELNGLNKNLERSNSELEQFAYIASHDLQEPLRKIMTFSSRLEQYKDTLPQAGQYFIERIAYSSQRMSRLIEDVLNFSKISMSAEQFVKTDLNHILAEVLTDLELIITQKKAQIHSELLPVVGAIPSQMDQLFHNLISNALKFSKHEVPPVIEIECHQITEAEREARKQLDQSKNYYEIVVKDKGIGFKPEFSEQIFNLFQRLNSSAEYSGTGIGLALCRKIVNTIGGEISAVSEEGEGSVFSVFLPEN